MTKSVEGIVSYIENILSEYYSFLPIVSATSFMINDAGLSAFNATEKINTDDFSVDRGSVLVVNDGDEQDVFIGLHIADNIVQSLEASDPLQSLDGHNLDKFCLLVEELSHFHLILNRISDKKTVSRLELVVQVSKLFFCLIFYLELSEND